MESMESIETMEKLNELLPGIEDFLVRILPQEKLSSIAEERRQYFVERLDILRLPPTIPPRAGKRLSLELLEESEEQCGIPEDQLPELKGILLPEDVSIDSHEPEAAVGAAIAVGSTGSGSEAEKDFAAEQRKISRNMLCSVSSDKDVNVGAGLNDIQETDSAKEVKVYDDIDPSESAQNLINNHSNNDIDDDDDDDINALYEIPVTRVPPPAPHQPTSPSEDASLSQAADISSSITTTAGIGSIDDISDDVLDANAPPWQPPPLPPRTKKKESESAESRVSTNSLESGGGSATSGTKPPELPFRPPLPRRNEVAYAKSEKSDKSEKSEKSDVSDGGSTSYESFDENDNEHEGNDLMSKLSIKLPKRSKKKSKSGGGGSAASKLLSSKARSSSTWEINVPFKKLDNVLISGEMLHKGKLSWNRRLVAISNGCLALYKPDKETRPVFVIPLAGFSACLGEGLGRKGFEMKMTHGNGESYTFAVDFKEWVTQWCEHINGLSQGVAVPIYHQHLARSFSGGTDATSFGSKQPPEGNLSNSNLSLSSDGVESDDSSKPRLRANKVMRMGSFAYRATQFFENLGKKSTSKRKANSLSTPGDVADHSLRDGIQEESSISSVSTGGAPVSPSSEATSPVFDESFRNSSTFSSPSSTMEFPPLPPTPPPAVPSNVKHQGYLNIFSSCKKRRWGQRWCLVRANMFECYRNQTSQLCELNFLLRHCVVRQALVETSSPLALMLLENNKEKITVEPPSKEELSQWLRVLMMETATESVPEGLEEYFVEVDDNQVEDLTAALEAEYSDIVGASVLKSWEVGSVPILPSTEQVMEDTAQEADQAAPQDTDTSGTDSAAAEAGGDGGAEVPDSYLYSTVIKRPSSASLDQVLGAATLTQEEKEGETTQPAKEEETKMPRFTDNLAVYNANKNTTDSGFYSVKEANSDSESGSDVKTESLMSSPAPPESSPEQAVAVAACSTPDDKGVSENAGGTAQVTEEAEEEESALEKTMTSEDFTENLSAEHTEGMKEAGGQDAVHSAANVECADEESDGCENGVSTERDASLSNSCEPSAAGAADKDTHAQASVADSQLTHSEDAQQQDRPKKKKKKGKGKKNKGRQAEQECSSHPSPLPGKGSVDSSVTSSSKSADTAATSAESTNCSSASANATQTAEGSQSSVLTRLSADKDCPGSATGPHGVVAGSAKGPEEDEMIAELKERIGQLREKLVQIKRKRIAVRDKRVRAFSAEERTVCDKEYLVLEAECKDTAANIQRLEDQLKACVTAAAAASKAEK